MVDSISSLVSLATTLQMQKTAQSVDVAVFNKAQDIQEQQGEAVLALIDAASVPNEGIDVHV